MGAPSDVLDVRSLTLPDWRTALKRRFNRPPRPKDWFCMIQSLLNGFWFFVDVLQGDIVGAAYMAVFTAGWWRWAWKGFPAFGPGHVSARPPDRLDWTFVACLAMSVVVLITYLGVAIFGQFI